MNKPLTVLLVIFTATSLLAETYSSLAITGKSTFGTAGTNTEESLVKIKQSSNTEWGAIITNNGGDGRGLLIQAGHYGNQNIQCLDVRDFAGNSRFKVNSDGSVQAPGQVLLGQTTIFATSTTIPDLALIKVQQYSNTNWGAIINNVGGNGKGLLIQSGSSSDSNVNCLEVRDNLGTSRFTVNSNGSVKIPGDVTLGTGWDGPVGEVAMVKIRQSNNTNWSAIITNGGGNGKGLLISSGSPGNSDVSCLEVKDASNYTTRFYVRSNGNTYIQNSLTIGTTTALSVDGVTAKLTVKGLIAATELKVRPVEAFPDYVFDDSYVLTPLSELKAKIKKDKHLPEIPSAKEIEKKGLPVGEMQVKMLKKIEELTLYTIKLNEDMLAQKNRIDAQEKEIQILKNRLHATKK